MFDAISSENFGYCKHINRSKLVLHYLVTGCHAEFDKGGWTDKLPTNEDGTPLEPEMMSEYYAAALPREGLSLVRFIGFHYRLNLLTGKMMFECFRRLMKDLTDSPSEETLESVVELLNTVGEQFETE
ncbi:CFC_HP_G0102320.mRNA.1.CDS.1 [Saccharomyces cerevisiae]|nr:CFC_HP_G0102320.mRNA.1.CDS.1 [Saccharomyces cerevisiae]CAI6904088.1 CFC_HP_G0102320.mRNA.1.CDS.1 [Saccharomyces cerevisiae]